MSDLIYYDNKNNKDSMYRTINLYCFGDATLSWKAKGLLCYLITRPKKWKVWNKDIKKRSSNGESSIRSGINELIKYRYVHRGKIYVNGKIKHWIHIVFSEPCNSISKKTKRKIEKLFCGNLFVENLIVENKVYSNNNIRKYNTIKLSKDNYTFSGENNNKKYSGFLNRCIDKWNELPLTQKHKKGTQLEKQTKKIILSLLKGTFGNQCAVNTEYLKLNKIPESLLTKKFTKKEIKKTINLLNYYYKEGYLPENKKYVPKSFHDMLYNPRSGISYFLSAFINPPKKDKPQEKHSELLELLPMENLSDYQKKRIHYNIQDLANWWKGVNEVRRNQFGHPINEFFGTPERLLKTYLRWVEHCNWVKQEVKDSFSFLNPDSNIFLNFIQDYQERECRSHQINPNDNRMKKYKLFPL